MAGTVNATSQTMPSTSAEPGHARRTPKATPKHQGPSHRDDEHRRERPRPNLVAPRTRSASRAMIATKSAIASSTRAGLTSCSMTRGSCATAMNALRGQSEPQLTHGAGVG